MISSIAAIVVVLSLLATVWTWRRLAQTAHPAEQVMVWAVGLGMSCTVLVIALIVAVINA